MSLNFATPRLPVYFALLCYGLKKYPLCQNFVLHELFEILDELID